MNILILGNATDAHAVHVKDALRQAGANVDYFDTQLFPTHLRISWQPDTQAGWLTLPEGGQLNLHDIHSNSLDFREDAQAQLIPRELPEPVRQQSLAITQALKLEWTALDWRLKPTGEYVFLEANPSPMFLHFEKQTGFPITKKLVKLLLGSQ